MLMTHRNIKKVIEFNVLLAANHNTNFQNMHICFPIKIKSAVDNNNDIVAGIITINNFWRIRLRKLILEDTAIVYQYYP